MVLFDETRVLNPQADKTNVALSFSVPPGLTALQVEFTYDPPTPPEPVAVEAVKAALSESGVTVLSNEFVPLEQDGQTIFIAGIDDPNGYADQLTPAELAIGEPPSSAID